MAGGRHLRDRFARGLEPVQLGDVGMAELEAEAAELGYVTPSTSDGDGEGLPLGRAYTHPTLITPHQHPPSPHQHLVSGCRWPPRSTSEGTGKRSVHEKAGRPSSSHPL